ncbi:MAG: DNA replication/repair protein RecF [Alphaproteobacteria bacterium]|nr:DNA replication/repair protein RecF [Alphaproteobacteria bacterium]
MSVAERANISVERLTLTNFRNYASAVITPGDRSVVLVGPNGSGKTNLLEAVSLLVPGQGLRRAAYADILRIGADGAWAVASRVHSRHGRVDIGTGQPAPQAGARASSSRIVRIDGDPQGGSGVLADYLEAVWLTPAMDGLFTGPAAERRRFLDRLVLCFDPGFRTLASRFERATQARNRLLADGVREPARLRSVELVMAEAGAAVAAARTATIRRLVAVIDARRARAPDSPFPWSAVRIEGSLENELNAGAAAVDVEDAYARRLADMRERDRAAARTLEGPHRSDLIVAHGPKAMPARLSSTGEQKALLIGLVLAEAELIAERHDGAGPLLLLDEITAHLDEHRRAALFGEILRLGGQAWMTGTDRDAFSALAGKAAFLEVSGATLSPLS